MVRYHRLSDRATQAFGKVQDDAETFISHVRSYLPNEAGNWWVTAAPSRMSPKDAREWLINQVGLKFDRPLDLAYQCAEKIKEDSDGLLLAPQKLRSGEKSLRRREEWLLENREEYQSLVMKEDEIRRRGNWEWYEVVQEVRGEAWEMEEGPYVQIDHLQALLLEDVDDNLGFRCSEENISKTALKNLVQEKGEVSWSAGSTKMQETISPRGNSIREDAVWALFLSIADGVRAPGPKLRKGGDLPATPKGIFTDQKNGRTILNG